MSKPCCRVGVCILLMRFAVAVGLDKFGENVRVRVSGVRPYVRSNLWALGVLLCLLGLGFQDWDLLYMVMAIRDLSEESVLKIALLNFALYKLYNYTHGLPRGQSVEALVRSGSIHISDAVRGCERAGAIWRECARIGLRRETLRAL